MGEIAKLLVESKIDLKAEDENGKTAEQIADDVKVSSASDNQKTRMSVSVFIKIFHIPRKMRWLPS